MKHLIVRTGIAVYRYTVMKMKDKVGANACMYLNESNYTKYSDKVAHRPMFSRYYLVELDWEPDSRLANHVISNLFTSNYVQCIVYVSDRDAFESLEQLYSKDNNFVFLDCYNVTPEFLDAYIVRTIYDLTKGEVTLSAKKAELIRKRVRYQEHILDAKLELLAFTDLTIKTITQHIPPYRGVTISTFPYHFFMGEKKGEIAIFLTRYRRYPATLYKPLLEFMATWDELYTLYLDGEISQYNYIEWMLRNGKPYGITKDYHIERWMKLFRKHSYERFVYFNMKIQTTSSLPDYEKILLLVQIERSI